MAALRITKKLADFIGDGQEEKLNNSFSKNTLATDINGEFVTEKFEIIQDRLTKILSLNY